MSGDSSKPLQEIVALEHPPGSPYPSIRWIGDLDRDDAPDLLIDLYLGEAGAHEYALFLSSASSKAERVHRVATLNTLGC